MAIKTKFFCEQADFGRRINIHAVFTGVFTDGSARESEAMVSARPIAENETTNPAFIISRDEAQTLMDQLWNCGMRPSEGSGSAGSLLATERHLEDMRKIAFATLKSRDIVVPTP